MLRGLCAALAAGAVVVVPAAAQLGPVSGWLTYGTAANRAAFTQQPVDPRSPLRELWYAKLDGAITSQVLVARNVPTFGDSTLYVGTGAGTIYALNANGFVRAAKPLGTMQQPNCPMIPGGRFGVPGTPVIDATRNTIYVADGLGLLHALDLVTLQERRGWPVRVFRDYQRRVVWSALTLVGGRIYVGTGLACLPAPGRMFAVDVASRKVVAAWTSVPQRLGGGGGVWGPGGPTYDAATDSLLVVTGNALPGGRNVGRRFVESAGYAEHIVQLSRNLRVRASHTPVRYRRPLDLDLTGSPVPVRAAGCPALVASQGKDGYLYVWRLQRIARGLYAKLRLAPKLNGQPAWSPRTRSLYVVGHRAVYRVELTRECRLRLVWTVPVPSRSVNSPPMIAGDVLWFGISDAYAIWAVDTLSGEVLWRGSLGEALFAPPTIVDGRIYIGGFSGVLKGFGV